MKKEVRIALLRILVAVVVFVPAFIYFDMKAIEEKDNAVAELANPSYPVMEIGGSDGNYNLMSGYRGDIDLSLVRNQTSVVDNSKTLELRLHNYDFDITAIKYILFKDDLKKPIEEGTLNRLEEDARAGVRVGTIQFDTTFREGETYYLRLSVRLNNSTRIFYYSKIQNAAGYHLKEYIDFARDFHDSLLAEEVSETFSSYLEPTDLAADRTLNEVNIHSSIDAVNYGSMVLKEERGPSVHLREINGTYAVIDLSTLASSELASGSIQYFRINETYKLRYTEERMYLLDYNRKMGAYYNETLIDSADNLLCLGIQNSADVNFLYSDGGRKVCFASQEQLWYYDYQSSNVSRIFSYLSENMADLRNENEDHGIKVLEFDDKGNAVYLAYGYITRGRHEGANGIQIMRFDAQSNCSEELAFLETSVPYAQMKADVERFSYLNKEDKFYCIVGGTLHEISLEEKTDHVIEKGLTGERLTASADQSLIALEKSADVTQNREIEMLDLESGLSKTFSVEENQRMRSVGFLGEDFIYGVALANDVSRQTTGGVTFPMAILYFVNREGKEVRTYQADKAYIMETKLEATVLHMTLGKKKNSSFTANAGEDFIRYKTDEKNDAVSLTWKYTEPNRNQLYFKFPNYIYIQVEPDLILTRTRVNEDNKTVILAGDEKKDENYYVYAAGKQAGSFDSISAAVRKADEVRGNVIDGNENVLWECIFAEYNKVAGMENVTKVKKKSQSLAACLSMIGAVNGRKYTVDELLEQLTHESVDDVLELCSGCRTRNLTGCSTDEILYYISKGSPVLARFEGTRYVVIMSYNSTKIRYLDPVTGLSTAVDRPALTKKLEKAGNVYYSYLQN